jgi:hypothetical protein
VWYGRSYCMLCVEASVLISVDVENDWCTKRAH